jgi:hypothetical protein
VTDKGPWLADGAPEDSDQYRFAEKPEHAHAAFKPRPDRPREDMAPESELNPPDDTSAGWKTWTGINPKTERQWSESYK